MTAVVRALKQQAPTSSVVMHTFYPEVFKNSPYVEQNFNIRGKSGLQIMENIIKEVEDVEVIQDRVLVFNDAFDIKNYNRHTTMAFATAIFGPDFELEDTRPELFSTEDDNLSMRNKLSLFYLRSDLPLAILHMTRSWSSRTWPQGYWDELTNLLIQAHYQVVVVGQSSDLGPAIQRHVHDARELFSLHELKVLLDMAQVFIGMDSGLMHVAQTTNIPIVALFTAVDPKYRITRPQKFKALIPHIECQFCATSSSEVLDVLAFDPTFCPKKDIQCTLHIQPQAVMAAVGELCALA
jgi:ADP-heptose:LPS heptosyltransferase